MYNRRFLKITIYMLTKCSSQTFAIDCGCLKFPTTCRHEKLGPQLNKVFDAPT